MEKPSSRSIEVTVISAEGLLVSRKQPVKKNAFVVVRSDPFNSGSTGMDREGGSYPVWNQKLVMELPVNARFLTVEAHSGSRLIGAANIPVIGAANIPVTDFGGGRLPENYLSFLSYRLRDGNGGKNGIINLSVKVIKGSSGGDRSCAASCARPWMGVPAADNKVSGGAVTGIPVPYRY
ncbi:bon1-associated protein 2 [Phtheirospermum japonicum]|uniref:Bon1-associated protein 2 n=1 Tax=Phtheirospermum japonicum TaxID=374723 RepID=A0A830C1Q4_9LAMI|nr:bon1-associated protein 2 [Phtheirospermum japonicum]